MRILVCGDREWTDREAIRRQLALVRLIQDLTLRDTGVDEFLSTPGEVYEGFCPSDPELVLIHGAARGADRIAGEEGAKLGFEVLPYPADWQTLGRAAGVIRNQVMLDDGHPDLVLAFHPDLARSKGTADMVRRARAAGIPTEVFPS